MSEEADRMQLSSLKSDIDLQKCKTKPLICLFLKIITCNKDIYYVTCDGVLFFINPLNFGILISIVVTIDIIHTNKTNVFNL